MTKARNAWLSIATTTALCLSVAGCTGGASSEPTDDDPSFVSANVDTPALREQKAAAGIDDCPAPSSAAQGDLPDVTLPCLGGGPDVDLADVRGPALVNLWATYCGPCRAEAPLLQSAHKKLGDRLQVLDVDYQEPDPGKAIAFADELGLTFPMVSDPYADLKADLRLPGLPMTLFVDDQGAVVYQQAGAIESRQELADLLSTHLGIDPGWAAG